MKINLLLLRTSATISFPPFFLSFIYLHMKNIFIVTIRTDYRNIELGSSYEN